VWYIPASEMAVGMDLYMVLDPDLRIYYVRLLQSMDAAYVARWHELYGPKEKR